MAWTFPLGSVAVSAVTSLQSVSGTAVYSIASENKEGNKQEKGKKLRQGRLLHLAVYTTIIGERTSKLEYISKCCSVVQCYSAFCVAE